MNPDRNNRPSNPGRGTEMFAVRSINFKYMKVGGEEYLFDLKEDPDESVNLFASTMTDEQKTQLDKLKAHIVDIKN